jgi:hypothetical protein
MAEQWGKLIIVPKEEQFTGLTGRAPPDFDAPEEDVAAPAFFPSRDDPDSVSVLGSSFRRLNDVNAAFDYMNRAEFQADPDYNPAADPAVKPYEEGWLDNFIESRSAAESRSIITRIDQEEKDREVRDRSGWKGAVGDVAASVLSPTVLVPLGGWVATSAKLGRAGRTAVRVAEGAGLTAAAVAAQEGVLQAAQETRSFEESAWNVAGGAIIGAALGGIVAKLGKPDIDGMVERVRQTPGSTADEVRIWNEGSGPVSAGAAATDSSRGTGELKGALGAEKIPILGTQDPLLRTTRSAVRETRLTALDLAETPLTRRDSEAGIVASREGPVEAQIREANYPLAQSLTKFDELYSQYAHGSQKRLAAARGTVGAMMGSGKLSYSQFMDEISLAWVNGDVHPIPEVEAAAKFSRQHVLDLHKEAAIEVRIPGYSKDMQPQSGDRGYAPRDYDTIRIRANPGGFKNEVLKPAILRAQRGAQAEESLSEFARLSDEEIDALLDDIIDNITHGSPARLLMPADIVAGPRGALKERVLNFVSTRELRPYLINNAETLLRRYTRTLAPDIALMRKFGSIDMVGQFQNIGDAYRRLIEAADTPAERLRLAKERDADYRDLAAVRDRQRGTYALPSEPDSVAYRTARVVKTLNYTRLLGGMTVSAFPDPGNIVAEYGLNRVMAGAWHPFVNGLAKAKLSVETAKMGGTALEMVLDSRAMAWADLSDDFGRGSKFERGVQAASTKFGLVTAMAPWNQVMKSLVSIIGQTRLLQFADKLAKGGKLSAKEMAILADAHIDPETAKVVAEQFAKHGEKFGGTWWANTAAWEGAAGQNAAKVFRRGLAREVDKVIVTPSQDKPLWMSGGNALLGQMGPIIGQFKTFGLASTQRTMLARLQRRDANALTGSMINLALGGLTYYTKSKLAGREPSEDPSVWTAEAIDRSGLLGWLGDANNILEKVTNNRLGLAAFTGQGASRYASRNIPGALAGPTFDALGGLAQIAGAPFKEKGWSESDTHAARQLIPLQNALGFKQALDKVEQAVNGAFGIPMKARN